MCVQENGVATASPFSISQQFIGLKLELAAHCGFESAPLFSTVGVERLSIPILANLGALWVWVGPASFPQFGVERLASPILANWSKYVSHDPSEC